MLDIFVIFLADPWRAVGAGLFIYLTLAGVASVVEAGGKGR